MVGEAIAGLSAIKTAFDIAKGLKDIDDATRRNAAVIELQEKILAAQSAQAALIEKVGALEKEMARLEAWEAEKQRYQLTDIGDGTFAYALKQSMQRGEPPHYICTNCYEQSKKSILNHLYSPNEGHLLSCSQCKTKLVVWREYKDPSYAESPEERDRAALEACPICQTGRLKITAIKDDPILGAVGVQRMTLKCDNPECRHYEHRQRDPLGRNIR
jgi:Zn finger protein HypA/HybF involved in hydrogenase expression